MWGMAMAANMNTDVVPELHCKDGRPAAMKMKGRSQSPEWITVSPCSSHGYKLWDWS